MPEFQKKMKCMITLCSVDEFHCRPTQTQSATPTKLMNYISYAHARRSKAPVDSGAVLARCVGHRVRRYHVLHRRAAGHEERRRGRTACRPTEMRRHASTWVVTALSRPSQRRSLDQLPVTVTGHSPPDTVVKVRGVSGGPRPPASGTDPPT